MFVLIAPSEKARKNLEDGIRKSWSRSGKLNAFDLHRIFISTLHENWRLYIRSLEGLMTRQSERVVLAQVQNEGDKLSPLTDFAVNFVDRQRLKMIEDKVLDLVIIFESCSSTIEELEEQMHEAQVNLKKADILHKRAQGTAQLLSDLLDYENAQIAHLNEQALNGLVKETKEENSKMRVLTERSTADAAAVKILTVITLIYLPVTVVAEGKSGSRGGCGELWGVRIHPAHQKLYHALDSRVTKPLLAIKRTFSQGIRDFKKEVNILRDLAVRGHPHQIELLATYKFKDNYHFMFPFANTNLRRYWDDTEMPHWNRDTYSWFLFLHQIRGLTSGLNTIHNFETELDLRWQDSQNGQLLTIAKQEAKFGRHGDIKPENILWSNEFGEDDPKTVNSSLTYAPPEIALEKPISQAYDIWSLGCLFLDFITWVIEGSA
ncbi:hypothetical protein EG329_001729 [Mollisiaceae sp. DMI_Dod_QoI]|nr:hypothetical protein EG329_001729 [Helotiales sp. DMI_Dod_QoI]